jgi:hypothetical protein
MEVVEEIEEQPLPGQSLKALLFGLRPDTIKKSDYIQAASQEGLPHRKIQLSMYQNELNQ